MLLSISPRYFIFQFIKIAVLRYHILYEAIVVGPQNLEVRIIHLLKQ